MLIPIYASNGKNRNFCLKGKLRMEGCAVCFFSVSCMPASVPMSPDCFSLFGKSFK
ncbi:hypothetical protein J4864_10730 [Prevotella multiformis]|nr:hypothetical protein J4864_10730 [Prevotella multiformis]